MEKDVIENDENIYTLYVHTCLETKKVYVGITYKEADERWRDGEGYKTNFELYSDIRKYGWEKGFFHQIVRDNLTYEKAKEAESFFIEMYDSTNPEKGYNHNHGGDGYGRRKERGEFGSLIKSLRKAKHITQQELADYLGVNRSTVSNYEISRRIPTLSDLKKIAEYFNVGLEYFGANSDVDIKFEVTSKILSFFKNNTIDKEEKVNLFNDVLMAYTHIVLNNE